MASYDPTAKGVPRMSLDIIKGKDPAKKKALFAPGAAKPEPQQAMELKKTAMADPRGEAGMIAFALLARSGDLDAAKKLAALLKDASMHVRLMAARSLVFGGAGALETILAALETADEETLAQFTEILRRLPKPDPDEFVKLLASQNPAVRLATVRVLGSFGANEKTVVALIKSLSSVDARMTEAIVQSLVEVGQKVLPILNKLVPTSPPRVVDLLLAIMGRIGEPAKALMHEALASGAAAVKRAAARHLAFADDDKTCDLLLAACSDKDALLAEAAAQSLAVHHGRFRDRMKRAFRESKSANQKYWLLRVFHHDPEFFEEDLLGMFRSEHAHDRILAIASVHGPHVPLIFNRLVEALNDENFYVRELSIDKLVGLSADRLPDLIKALGDARANVVDGVVETLRRLGEKAVDHLIELVNRGNDQQKINASHALGLLGSRKALAPLRAILQSGNDWVRLYALGALGHLGDMETLLKIVQKGPEDNRKMAMKALSGMGAAALNPLMLVLRETRPDAREGIAQTIGSLGEAIRPKIEEFAEAESDENIRFWLMKILRMVARKGDLA